MAIAMPGPGTPRPRRGRLPASQSEPDDSRRFEILGHAELPITNIHPNPYNPRPSFHFSEDDAELRAMADSIRADGLHQPLKVYEIDGEPAQYRIIQGHRRRQAATFGHVEVLDCIIVKAPPDLRTELELLGSEDAYKLDWGLLYKLQYAHDLALELKLPSPYCDEIAVKTGLTRYQLKLAEKVFQLEPAILAMVKEYEEAEYANRSAPKRRGRIGQLAGINTANFTVEKAALVFDLWCALKEAFPLAIKDMTDVEAQRAIATLVSYTTKEDGENFLNQVRNAGRDTTRPRAGTLARIHAMLETPTNRGQVKAFLRNQGVSLNARYGRFLRKAQTLDAEIQRFTKRTDAIGTDKDDLLIGINTMLNLSRHADELERKLDRLLRKAMEAPRA